MHKNIGYKTPSPLTCLGVLRGTPLSRARKGKRVLGRKGNPCSERGFPFLPKKTERSKGTPPLKEKNIYKELFMKKRFSLKNKLVFIFGALIALASLIEGLLAIRIARKAVMEKVTTQLIDKANDTTEIIDGRIRAFFQFAEGLARMPELRAPNPSPAEKTGYLEKQTETNSDVIATAFVNMQGIFCTNDGRQFDVSEREWFKTAKAGTTFVSEPYISKLDKSLCITVSVPVHDDGKDVIGVLMLDIKGEWFSEQIKDIVVGKTGNCYIMGDSGNIVGNKDISLVKSQVSIIEQAKTDKSLASTAAYLEHVWDTDESEVGYYTYKGESYISSFATMKTTDWSVIIRAPVNEFMGTVNALSLSMLIISIIILISSVVVVFFCRTGNYKTDYDNCFGIKKHCTG